MTRPINGYFQTLPPVPTKMDRAEMLAGVLADIVAEDIPISLEVHAIHGLTWEETLAEADASRPVRLDLKP